MASPNPLLNHEGVAPRKRACDSCYKRKIQCDGADPQCNWCSHHGIACTFSRPTRVKKSKAISKSKNKHETNKGLAERIERLEELVSRTGHGQPGDQSSAIKSPTSPPSTDQDHLARHSFSASTPVGAGSALPSASSPASSAGPLFGKLHFAGYQLGDISSSHGIPLFSSTGRQWIRDKTGGDTALPFLAAPLWENQHLAPKGTFSTPSLNLELPPADVVEKYFQLSKTTTFRFTFPIVDSQLFRETIDTAYAETQSPGSIEELSAKACVLAFVCLTNLFLGRIEDAPVNGELCAVQAQKLLPHIIFEPTIANLQICLSLAIYCIFSGRIQSAAMYHSCACRVVFMLGAHVISPEKLARMRHDDQDSHQLRVKTHLRKLFWLCYTFDKDISLRTGQPPCLEDDYCDLSLPDGFDEMQSAPDPLSTDDDSMPYLPRDPRLSLIKAKAGKLLYAAKALSKSDAELLRDIRELDDELERWRMSITPEYRPTLSPSSELHEFSSNMTPPKRMHFIVIHFEYYYLMATIHQATSRCTAWAGGETDNMEGVSSSLKLSVQASRSTLIYLRAAVHMLLGESFWVIFIFPMSAILTIFFNVLLKPLDPQARDDLELLKTTPELIKKMRARRLTPHEAAHMKLVEDFITELIRLGHCAIQNAGST